jgi:methyltransferase (TIGR00027 family)
MAQRTAIESAETMAALRAIVTNESDLAVRCQDPLAKHFLGLKNRIMAGIRPQPLLKGFMQLAAPGSYCFTIVRTRHFDEILLSEIRSGIEQVVLLGAGYDSRAFRFQHELQGVKVFEIDHPGTQARKKSILATIGREPPANVTYISVDFNRQSFQAALAKHGFAREKKTLFLWEGVSYYLPQPVVEGVLGFVSTCAAGSSIVFDYAIKSFVDGDTSTYGGKEVARWLKKIREPFLFGLDPKETEAFVASHKLRVVSDLGPEESEQAYLRTTNGSYLGKTFGHVRIVHARATGSG